jgi:hypothetical protein
MRNPTSTLFSPNTVYDHYKQQFPAMVIYAQTPRPNDSDFSHFFADIP